MRDAKHLLVVPSKAEFASLTVAVNVCSPTVPTVPSDRGLVTVRVRLRSAPCPTTPRSRHGRWPPWKVSPPGDDEENGPGAEMGERRGRQTRRVWRPSGRGLFCGLEVLAGKECFGIDLGGPEPNTQNV